MEYLIEMFADGSFIEYRRVSEVARALFCDVAVATSVAPTEPCDGVFVIPRNGERGLADAVKLLNRSERSRRKRYWATIISWSGDKWLNETNIEMIRTMFEQPDSQIISLVEGCGCPTGVYAFRADTMRRLSLLCAADSGPCQESWTRERFCVKRVVAEK